MEIEVRNGRQVRPTVRIEKKDLPVVKKKVAEAPKVDSETVRAANQKLALAVTQNNDENFSDRVADIKMLSSQYGIKIGKKSLARLDEMESKYLNAPNNKKAKIYDRYVGSIAGLQGKLRVAALQKMAKDVRATVSEDVLGKEGQAQLKGHLDTIIQDYQNVALEPNPNQDSQKTVERLFKEAVSSVYEAAEEVVRVVKEEDASQEKHLKLEDEEYLALPEENSFEDMMIRSGNLVSLDDVKANAQAKTVSSQYSPIQENPNPLNVSDNRSTTVTEDESTFVDHLAKGQKVDTSIFDPGLRAKIARSRFNIATCDTLAG